MSIRRSLLVACAAAVAAPSLLAAQGVRVTPYAGMTPVVAVAGGGQVEVGVARNLSVFADYNRWGWGLICTGAAVEGEEDRCGETGWTLHGGATLHLADVATWRRPYLALGVGAAQVLEAGENVGEPRASLSGEGGIDFGGSRVVNLRLGLRWQGRPGVGTDYVGPVVGIRLRLR